jgi:hypothetical protein
MATNPASVIVPEIVSTLVNTGALSKLGSGSSETVEILVAVD